MRKCALLTLLVLLHWPGAFAQLVVMPSVAGDRCRLSPSAMPRHEEGAGSTVDFSLNAVSFARSRYPELRGQGVTICLKENAPDPTDIDLRGRLLPSAVASSVVTPHATQMAEIIAGVGNSSLLNEGIAPKASLVPASFSSLLPEADAFYTRNRVTVVNHSYGTDIENFYGAEALAYDASIFRLPTILHVFSAGNLGYASPPAGIYANLPAVATLTGNFKMAKNSLVVGAVDAGGNLLASSSRGPAYDGRLKPELVAYSDEGSSGAAALTSGVSALLQQAYTSPGFHPQTSIGPPNASAALLKAVLINSADDRGSPGPDYQTGYGSVNAFAAVKTIAEQRYLEGIVTAGGHFEAVIRVPAARQLKITLVWTDPPASLNSPKALINDLDLTVSDGDTSYRPWVLNPAPNVDSLGKLPVRMRDTLNNAEQVTLDLPAPGQYTIRVNGTQMATGSQTFAVAYQWDPTNTFYWTTPNTTTPAVSDTTLTIRWKNTTPARYGTLDFSPDRGQSWIRVRDSVLLVTGAMTWRTPALLTTGLLRMRIADSVYRSDSFLLSPVPSPTVLYACADSLAVAWTTVADGKPVGLHNLYRLADGDSTWHKTAVLIGNRTVIKGVWPGDRWAVAPVSPAGGVGIRSEPFGSDQVFCYYRTFTADLVDGFIRVRCELSTTEGVADVTFQKQTAQSMQQLKTQPVIPTMVFYSLTDSLLQEGPNTYRLQIRLKNGAAIYPDVATAYVVRKIPFLLYPNPVETGQMLTVRTEESGVYALQLIDETGRVVRSCSVTGTAGNLSTAGLSAGVYTCVIFKDNQRVQTGKVVVR